MEEAGIPVDMRTLRTMLKAEQKTVSSILHASSQAQVTFVVAAAYRRIGLGAQAAELERSAVKPGQRRAEDIQSQPSPPAGPQEQSAPPDRMQTSERQEDVQQQGTNPAELTQLLPTLVVLNQQMQFHSQSLTALGQACRDMAVRCDTTMDTSKVTMDAVSQRLEQVAERLVSLEDRFAI